MLHDIREILYESHFARFEEHFMDAGITAGTLVDAVYTHPTMTEAFNDLFF